MFTAFRVIVSSSIISLNIVDWNNEDVRTYTVRNGGPGDIIVGDSTVTSGTGFYMAAGDVHTFTLNPHDVMYAIRAASTDAIVHIIQT